MSSQIYLINILKLISKKLLIVFYVLFSQYLTAKTLMNGIQTPNSFILKDAKIHNNQLFVLCKNNGLFCFKINDNSIVKHSEKSNMHGIFNDSKNIYSWNEHEVFVYNSSLNEWQLQYDFKERSIKRIISSFGNIKVVFFDGIFCLKNNQFSKSPFPIKQIIDGNETLILCNNKYTYKLTKEDFFIKDIKLDSTLFIKDLISYDNQIACTINNHLKVINTQSNIINHWVLPKNFSSILGIYNNKFVCKNENGINVLDVSKNENTAIVSEEIYNVKLLNNGNFIYNDNEGQCIYYQNDTKSKMKVGLGIKAYNIVDYWNENEQQIIITTEGFLYKQNEQNKTSFIDLSNVAGKIFSSEKYGSEIFIACQNGLVVFNSNSNTYFLNSDLQGVICNSIHIFEKSIYIGSAENGIYKIKLGKQIGANPKVILVNDGLLLASVYLLKSYDGELYAVSKTGVYKKEHNKDKWLEYSQSGFINHISGIAHFKKSCEVLVISSYYRGVLKSNDEGKTYYSMNFGLEDTSIIALEVDTTGFYALTKSGVLYFHAHDGIEWSRINEKSTPINKAFLRTGVMYLVNNSNQIDLLKTNSMKPELHINWVVNKSYFHGNKITLSYKFTGHVGQNNRAVLQLIKASDNFINGAVIAYSNLNEGYIQYTIPDSLELGAYQIRLVGTEPFIRTPEALATFEIKQDLTKIVAIENKKEKIIK